MPDADLEARRAGYVSERARQRFTAMAVVLGGAFLILHLVLITLVTVVATPLIMAHVEVGEIHAGRAAWWRGQLYAVRTTRPAAWPHTPSSTQLVRVTDADTAVVSRLDSKAPYLLAGDDALFLVTTSTVAAFEGERVRELGVARLSDPVGRPFLYRGHPTLIDCESERATMRSFERGSWDAIARLSVSSIVSGSCALQGAGTPEGLRLFKEEQGALLSRPMEGDDGSWEVVTTAPGTWHAYGDTTGAHVLSVTAGEVRLLSRQAEPGDRVDRWTVRRLGLAAPDHVSEVSAIPRAARGELMILLQGMPGSVRVIEWSGDRVVSNRRFGEGWFFPRRMCVWMLAPQVASVALTLILAVVMTRLMSRHRLDGHVRSGIEARYATLTRRAIGQIVDAAVAGLPGLVLVWWGYGRVVDVFDEGPALSLRLLTMVAAVGAWVALMLAGLGVGEGLWGVSPGKWIAGVRVLGDDLRPCGIPRAVIRNVLKLVDGLLGFLVGTLLVAFTPHWQRLGDLAAQTIVVRVAASSPPTTTQSTGPAPV